MDDETLAMLSAMHRDPEFDPWGIWVPSSPGSPWRAVRPAGSRPPGPSMPLLWVESETAVGLRQAMARANITLGPHARWRNTADDDG